ncbi:MAG: autotransporter domain-containing protein [Thermoguttaceae bacterium]|nr:autotransporter domain-containing protein [Thermoguttaceae bacterium]
MKQNLKQKSVRSKAWQCLCTNLAGLGMAAILWNSSLFIPSAQADVFTANFTPGTLDDDYNTPTRNFTPDEENAVRRALAYVNSVVVKSADNTTHEIRFLIHDYTDLSEPANHKGFDSYLTNAHANYDVDKGLHICYNEFDLELWKKYPKWEEKWAISERTWSLKECTQFMNGAPSMQATSIHEMAHNLGMTFTTYIVNKDDSKLSVDTAWSNQIIGILPSGGIDTRSLDGIHTNSGADNLNQRLAEGVRYYFTGNEATKVYGDYWVTNSTAYLPVENAHDYGYVFQSGSTLSHSYTRFGRLNAYSEEPLRPFYNEAELALLKDVGNTVNIRQQFGRSLYQENKSEVSVTNTQNYGANWNEADQTYDNTPNTALYGIGLHIVGDRYNVTQAANLLADGKNGTGIRVEGTGNTVTINPSVRVTGNGENGIGVLATHGNDNILNNRGTIEATGTNGTAVYLNYGSWTDPSDNSYSVEGGLKTFDNTGTINAGAANNAILINNQNASLTINIMGGAITGNITSKDAEWSTSLTFGKQADANGMSTETGNAAFNMTYAGNIDGKDGIELEQWGGNLTLTGSVIEVNDLFISCNSNAANSTFNAPGSINVKSNVELGNRSQTVIYDGKSTGSLVSSYINNKTNSTIQNVDLIQTIFLTNSGNMNNVSTVDSDNFQNNGDITVGETGSVSTMNVEGHMVNTGTLNIDANLQAAPVSGTTADLINVSKNGSMITSDGTVTIEGGWVYVNELNSTGSSYYRAGINHNIIETEEGVKVIHELNAKETGFDIPLFKPVIGHDDKNVWISLQRDFLYGPAGETENQKEIGNYLDEIGKTPNPDGDLFTVLLQLDGLNADKKTGVVSERALEALDEMSGAVYGTVSSLANQHSTMINNSLAKHLRDWSPCAILDSGWNVWAEAYGMGGNAKHDGNANGYNYSVAGTLVGIDHEILVDGHIGAYFAAGATNANIKGLSESADSTDIFAGGYINLKDTGIWYTTIFGGIGYSNYEVERHFTFIPRDNKSEFDSWQVNAYVERGINLSFSNLWILQPFAGLQFIRTERDSIQEEGADLLDLTVEEANMSSLRSLFGIKLATSNCATGRKLNGQVSAAWMHEYIDASSTFSAQMSNPGGAYFESSPSFVIRGHNDGRDWFVTGLGLNYAFTDNLKIFGGYDCMINGVGAMHMGNLGLEFNW